ncbi:MAG: DUF389 domain-containing protein [Gallionellaceae bacterium]|nr:DUF389 domain-containing protein [Gallionellaceae bacterium]
MNNSPGNSAPETPALFQNRLFRLFSLWWRRHMRDLDRDATNEQVQEEGGLSYSYAFLVVTSCGIATLGLMLNSAAVIIGAMLVAPLMGPIVLLGFAIAKTDVELVIRSAKAMVVGVLAALAISVVIVKLSPYIPPTPEILARTNPNLFDLLVAVLSGMVAGYAVTHRKIGTVAGVAIATALMPPLAASGYGLATGDMRIFQGAFFLFLTNLLAIAFSVATMAMWYGFGNLRTPKNLIWQTTAAGVILVVLSIPLIRTLDESVTKTLTLNQVEDVLRQDLKLEGARLDKLDVRITDGQPVAISAVVYTREFDQGAHDRLLPLLQRRLERPVELALDQVVLGDAQMQTQAQQSILANPIGAAPQSGTPLSDAQLLVRHLREVLPLPLTLSEVDANAKVAKLQVAPGFSGSLNTLRQMEENLKQRFPAWRIALIPPMRPLPDIRFLSGETGLEASGQQALKTSLWALARWQVDSVRVTGAAALNENGRKTSQLARQRADLITGQLHAAGLAARGEVDYPAASQKSREKELGVAAWRIARIQPLFDDATEETNDPAVTADTRAKP